MPDLGLYLQLGIGGAFLVILFLGLARSALYTKAAHDEIVSQQEKRIAEKNEYIEKLEKHNQTLVEINKKVDDRNDLYAAKVDQVLEIARAQGILQALPPQVGERVVR